MKKALLLVIVLCGIAISPLTAEQYPRRSQEPLYLSTIQVGLEAITSTSTVKGGAYLYALLSTDIIPTITLTGKYSTDITPNLFQNHLFNIYTRFNIFYFGHDNPSFGSIAPNYSFYTNFSTIASHNAGVRICFFSVGTITHEFSMEILPFEINFQIDTKEFFYKFELFNIGFRF